jgi:hypothetical protein
MLQRVRLSMLVLALTALSAGGFGALALAHRRAAPLFLAGALLLALHGLGWLLALRHYRVRLRRAGFRW